MSDETKTIMKRSFKQWFLPIFLFLYVVGLIIFFFSCLLLLFMTSPDGKSRTNVGKRVETRLFSEREDATHT